MRWKQSYVQWWNRSINLINCNLPCKKCISCIPLENIKTKWFLVSHLILFELKLWFWCIFRLVVHLNGQIGWKVQRRSQFIKTNYRRFMNVLFLKILFCTPKISYEHSKNYSFYLKKYFSAKFTQSEYSIIQFRFWYRLTKINKAFYIQSNCALKLTCSELRKYHFQFFWWKYSAQIFFRFSFRYSYTRNPNQIHNI
jgi:hypothetical protein